MTPVPELDTAWLRTRLSAVGDRLRAVRSDAPLTDGDHTVGPTVGAAVVFDAFLYASVRYAPEYLRLLGSSAVVIGLFGSVGIAVRRYTPSTLAGVPRWLLAGLAALGVFLWTIAGAVGGAAVLLLAGTVLVGPWSAVSTWRLDRSPGERGRPGYHPTAIDGRSLVAIGGVLFVTLVLTAGTVLAGLRVTMALATTFGVAVTIAAAVEEPWSPPTLDSLLEGPARPSLPLRDAPGRVADAVRAVPSAARAQVFGAALVTVAPAAISVFVVVMVTTTLETPVAVGGLQLGPAAAFGLLLTTELAVGALSHRLGDAFERRFGPRLIALWGLFVSATFPLLLVSVSATFGSFLGLFALYGTRFAGIPARNSLLAEAIPETSGSELPTPTRRLRDAMVVAAPAMGGVLYSASPVLAFGVATSVGAIGLREYARACYL